MEWRDACGFGIILWLFFSLFLLCELKSLFFFTWNAIKVYRQWVPCGPNSSYSFPSFVLKLCRWFWHGMKMYMWFGYNTLIIFSHFFCYVNLVSFLHEMLSKCIASGYLVGATPLTVFHRLFWNFADVSGMEWRYACDIGILLWLFFLTFSALWI